MTIFHYLSNLFNPFIFSRPNFFFFSFISHSIAGDDQYSRGSPNQREMADFLVSPLQSKKKSPRQDCPFFHNPEQCGKSISSSLFLFFLSQHILTFLVYFTKFRLFDGCYPIGPWGAEMYLTANKFRYINLSFCPGHYFLFQHNTIQG